MPILHPKSDTAKANSRVPHDLLSPFGLGCHFLRSGATGFTASPEGVAVPAPTSTEPVAADSGCLASPASEGELKLDDVSTVDAAGFPAGRHFLRSTFSPGSATESARTGSICAASVFSGEHLAYPDSTMSGTFDTAAVSTSSALAVATPIDWLGRA